MTRISVTEAATRLGVDVSRVRQRIADGSLAAEKVGHQWVIDAADVQRVDRRSAGRPLSPRSAWALAWVAGGGTFDAAHDNQSPHASGSQPFGPDERSRARARLHRLLRQVETLSSSLDPVPTAGDSFVDDDPTVEVAASVRLLLKNRAQRLLFRCSPRDLGDLRDDNRLKLAGISLAGAGIAAANMVEAYLSASDLDRLVEEFLLVATERASANVVFHVVAADHLQLSGAGDNWLLTAADLAEYQRPRETVRAAELLFEAARRRSTLSPAAAVG